MKTGLQKLAIIGGGPAGLFIFKKLVDGNARQFAITIIEQHRQLGAGMPYSKDGACKEHITNVSGNEIPEMHNSVTDWLQAQPKELLHEFGIEASHFNEYKVLPRLLFGEYLSNQFKFLIAEAKRKDITVDVLLNTCVTDVQDDADNNKIFVVTGNEKFEFDVAVISTGHIWPKRYEGKIKGWFDAPYPPKKVAIKLNHAVAIRGSSLTAIDAIRTLARANGSFYTDDDGALQYKLSDGSADFRMVMHSRNGLLPAVRFHLEDPQLFNESVLDEDEIKNNREANNGFLSLDFIFEYNFKKPIQEKDPDFYNKIKDIRIEEFVDLIMTMRENIEPFNLLEAEYKEAAKSIKRKESVYWKEMLAVLSYTMNYPAKYFSAEDMLRLQHTLMPLISVVIAFVPQSSVIEMLVLHKAGLLQLIPVGSDSHVEPNNNGGADYYYRDEDNKDVCTHYNTFIDSVGQSHLAYNEVPFKSLVKEETISPARLKFKDNEAAIQVMADNKNIEKDTAGNYFLRVPGVTINDNFQAIDKFGAANTRLYIMAVPFIGGYNPDYSGLDFCDTASTAIAKALLHQTK